MQRAPLPSPRPTWWLDIFFLTLILGGLFFILLGERPLFVPDEGRYAEIAREMAASGHYVTPHLNGIKYFEKPALFYWLEAAAIHLFGLNLWSVRSINALLALFGCLLTYVATRKLYDRSTGLYAALILATSSLFFVMTHMVSLDLPVSIFLALTLYAFIIGIQEPKGRARRYYFWGASLTAACAVLTKGLIGIVFPSMIIFAWLTVCKEWRSLKHSYLPSCLLIFLLIAAPWHFLVGQHNPEFFYFYFIKQHFLRYTMLKIGHYQPVWFFIPILLLGFFPWIIFLPQLLIKTIPNLWLRNKNKIDLFFLIWIALIFIFFSFSKSKLIPYILPIFPPLAILTARYLQTTISTHSYKSIKISYVFFLVISIILAITLFIYPIIYLQLAGISLATGAMTANYFIFLQQAHKAIIATITTTGIFLLLLLAAMPYLDTRTVAPLTTILKPILTAQDEVVSYNQYYQDLPFYLERRVSILNWKNELRFGMEHQDTSAWMINYPVFWQRWNGDHRMFVMLCNDEYDDFRLHNPKITHYLIGKTKTTVLISNRDK